MPKRVDGAHTFAVAAGWTPPRHMAFGCGLSGQVRLRPKRPCRRAAKEVSRWDSITITTATITTTQHEHGAAGGGRPRRPGQRADPGRALPPFDVPPRRPARRGPGRGRRAGRHGRHGGSGPGPATARPRNGFLWLAGDHHIHTQYSSRRAVPGDRPGAARLRVRPGLDGHHRPRQRRRTPRSASTRSTPTSSPPATSFDGHAGLPGPGVEHPGRRARHRLRAPRPQRGRGAQGVRERLRRRRSTTPTASTPGQRGARHRRPRLPGRRGAPAAGSRTRCSSPTTRPARASTRPHEIRGWRDASPGIAVGMEGAPGHQAAGIPTPLGAGGGRGVLRQLAQPRTRFAGYPLESYRTWGGFDWMTATVGGLWDSLLAEGKPWWITANSDSHKVYARRTRSQHAARDRGALQHQRPLRRPGPRRRPAPDRPTATSGRATTAAPTSAPTDFSYAAVMAGHPRRPGLGRPRRPDRRPRRAGAQPAAGDRGAPLGRHAARRAAGAAVELVITIDAGQRPELGPVRARSWPGSTSSAARSPAPVDRPGQLHRPGHQGRQVLRRQRGHRHDRP